jgi:two-component system, chemotaxis family, CheB/CheR fusion protein
MTDNENRIFEELLEYLKQSRGFDFTGYKKSSLKRRILRQMQLRNISTLEEYLDYLQIHQEEFPALFNTILINVTGFFRDNHTWQYLQEQALSFLVNEKSSNSPIRVWSAGCASGEESYTLAIVLAEVLGIERFRQQVKIYATDVDEEALKQARQACYSASAIDSVPSELRDRYFEAQGERYVFRADLRRAIIFGRHDLVQDAPISRLDLLTCRNTLMYFNAETQAKILNRFHFALNDTGILFLGKAEMLLTHTNLFTPISLPCRIFRRVSTNKRQDRRNWQFPLAEAQKNHNFNHYSQLQKLAFDFLEVAQLVVDAEGNLLLANVAAREMLGINVLDLGRPLKDLEVSYRPLELRSYLETIAQERQNITINDVIRNLPSDSVQYLDVQFQPLEDEENQFLGTSIIFTDRTSYENLKKELHQANEELETANEELQSSNEELETTNEELQSTNEELETTNEELQSTNEELETINEELQSTNEELQAINDELRMRTSELNQSNAFLSSILGSLKACTIVLNRQFNILNWNKEAENLWGLRADELKEQSLFSLDIGLPVTQLREPIRKCLNGEENNQEITLEAINRRGKKIQCRVSFNPLIGMQQDRQGVILLIEAKEIEKR